MVNNHAIIDIVSKITEKNSPPCKKALQKIIFLIEAKHVDLGCDYGIHFYGPYSSDLDFAVRELSDEGILQIDYTPMEHFISVADISATNPKPFNNVTVNEVIDEFAKDTPSELELLATTLYVYLQAKKDTAKVKPGVVKIKGKKYSEMRLDAAIDRLVKTGYIVK